MPDGWNANIDDENINSKTDKETILYQASVFNKYCRVFAPRYRQANIEAFYTNNKEAADAAFDTAYNDVKMLLNITWNIIITEGRSLLLLIARERGMPEDCLKNFLKDKPLEKQLVCAYIVGLPVFTNYFSELKPC